MEEQGPERRRNLRARVGLLLALAVFAGGTVGVPVAAGEGIEGGNSFNELSKKAQEEENTETTATTTGAETETHNSNKTVFIGAGAAIVLLLAIGYVIVKDARKVAPAGAEDIIDGGRKGRDSAVRQRNRRAKAKAAKSQRKKNR